MSRNVSLLALLFGVGIFVLLLSFARTDLRTVSGETNSLELRHSISYHDASASKRPEKRQLLAFIGVQVCLQTCPSINTHTIETDPATSL